MTCLICRGELRRDAEHDYSNDRYGYDCADCGEYKLDAKSRGGLRGGGSAAWGADLATEVKRRNGLGEVPFIEGAYFECFVQGQAAPAAVAKRRA